MTRAILLAAITLILSLKVSAIDLNSFFNYKYEKEIYVVKKEFGFKYARVLVALFTRVWYKGTHYTFLF